MFELAPADQPSPRQLLLAQIQRMEAELTALKTLVEQMPR